MNVTIEYPADILAATWWNDTMLMNAYSVRCRMITATKDNIEQNIALERLKYTMFHVMQNAVMIDSKERQAIKRLEAAGIRTIPLPEAPVDQIVGMMLYSKIDAVMEGRILVTQLKLSSELGDNVSYFQRDNETIGPFSEKGWWNSPDPVYSDANAGGKVVSIRGSTTWQHLGLDWDQSTEEKSSVVLPFPKDETE